MKEKLNAFGRFAREMDKMAKEESKSIAKGGGDIIPESRPQTQQLSISPGTLIWTRILFGKFKE